jgi:hypothetical protein
MDTNPKESVCWFRVMGCCLQEVKEFLRSCNLGVLEEDIVMMFKH